jgi:putative component of toxin-antitoxin plasmid stabilization module
MKQVRAIVHAVLLGGGTRAFRARYKARRRLQRPHPGAAGDAAAAGASVVEGRGR